MAPANENGPDGSSIKPVSSLRARFENMSKVAPDSLPPPSLPLPNRSISPAPKPDRLREPSTSTNANRLSQTPVPKPKPTLLAPIHAHTHAAASISTPGSETFGTVRTPNRLSLQPPLSPAPALLIQPPQSPPRGRAHHVASASSVEPSAFLNPDTVFKPPVSPSSSPRPFKIPSRPHTPSNALNLCKSPRLSPSRAPSPPPPRRSAELKRERERERDLDRDREREPVHAARSPAPPVANRADKPKIPPHHITHPPAELLPLPLPAMERDSRSPFNSPPSGSESQGEDIRPSLPTRPARPQQTRPQQPRPQQTLQHGDRTISAPPPRTKAAPVTTAAAKYIAPRTFEPPPVHHAVASRRIEREQEVTALTVRSPVSSMGPPPRPPLPTRPQATTEPVLRTHHSMSARTTRAPRPVINTRMGVAGANEKRVVSNPTTSSTLIFPPPPMRTRHGRSMTVDRAGGRPIDDVRQPSTPLGPSMGPPLGAPLGKPAGKPIGAAEGAMVLRNSNMESTETLLSPGQGRSADAPSIPFPDSANINRRPPWVKQGQSDINARTDCRVVDVCGHLVCTTGHITRVWSLVDGDLLFSLALGENVRGTAVAFRPGSHVDDEGTRLWIGSTVGELTEVDIATQSVVATKPGAHSRHEIVKIHRHFNELWTLDDGGALYVWGPDEDGGVPTLAGNQHQSYRVPRGHTFSMVVDDELWHAAGKELRVFVPTLDGKASFQVLMRALCQESAGEISAGTTLVSDSDRVFFGHTDGKVSIYSRRDYGCLGVVSLGSYKINSMAGANGYVWAGYNTGRLCVYDPVKGPAAGAGTPWVVKKEWQAHESPVVKVLADRSSAFRVGQVQVVSLGADSLLRVWDGLLQDDWLEEAMQDRDAAYCTFETLKAQVMTWNAGASTPASLRYAESDARFLPELLQDSGPADVLVFGFQELVDLEDKTATAKRFLKPKKKEGSDQERMSHQYRDWRDFLVRSLDDNMGGQLYQLLQTAHMVGLFTCVFVKADLRDRIRSVCTTEVKRGMGGLHGNKGAIAVRFLVDDTSLCLVNCHLAAGQSQAAHRHNDIAAILESATLATERDATVRMDSFVGGGDGSMILDHELVVLNGDLNYRIDTMSRDTVVAAVRSGNLAKLLERDQLLVARRRNAAFRLRAFEELPIAFAPTYKYDVGTDTYDSSEKKRSPAWCDRVLFRGGRGGRVQQLDYRRHEVRVSDHRPVTGRFALTVKRVDPKRRAVAWMECQQAWEDHRARALDLERMYYLTHVIGYDEPTSRGLVDERHPR